MKSKPSNFIYDDKAELEQNLFDLFIIMDCNGSLAAIPEMEKYLNNSVLSNFSEVELLAKLKEHLLNGEFNGVKLPKETREQCLKWINERGGQHREQCLKWINERRKQQRLVNNIIPENILDKLEQKGLIQKEPLKWNKSKALLAYFVEVANDELNLWHGEKRQIRPFEVIFNIKGLTGAKNDYKKIGVLPIGYKEIDKIFK